uniref:Uncharacterized protein n=1 Tax=Rhodosorus marinus TaxID=101924 RepID=A0A7S0BLZ8_9RHOD|mmetsp:Transcript_20533/g.29778  ORF Transcript_20533/g.29778 Transcript_20533/m.29778 type:complete len:118 (+) Transcript_20533:327-680(+)
MYASAGDVDHRFCVGICAYKVLTMSFSASRSVLECCFTVDEALTKSNRKCVRKKRDMSDKKFGDAKLQWDPTQTELCEKQPYYGRLLHCGRESRKTILLYVQLETSLLDFSREFTPN